MARDRALLAAAERGEAGARVYGWDGLWVSLGRFQSPERDLVSPSTTRWVMRPTGGRAVLHGHDVTVGLAAPLEALGISSRGLRPAYRAVVGPLVEGLRACGVPAVLAEDRRAVGASGASHSPAPADCFAVASPNDVVDERTGAKVCGCALRLTEWAVLVQASLPHGTPLAPPDTVIRDAALTVREWDPTNFAEALREAWACLLNRGKIGTPSRANSS